MGPLGRRPRQSRGAQTGHGAVRRPGRFSRLCVRSSAPGSNETHGDGCTATTRSSLGPGTTVWSPAQLPRRAGKRVLVVEAREVVGGACVTEELISGAKWSCAAFIAGLVRPEIIDELELRRFGSTSTSPTCSVQPVPRRKPLFLFKELDRTLREIERYSNEMPESFLDFGLRIQRFAAIVTPWLLQPPPRRARRCSTPSSAPETTTSFNEFVPAVDARPARSLLRVEHLKGFLTFFGMISIWASRQRPGPIRSRPSLGGGVRRTARTARLCARRHGRHHRRARECSPAPRWRDTSEHTGAEHSDRRRSDLRSGAENRGGDRARRRDLERRSRKPFATPVCSRRGRWSRRSSTRSRFRHPGIDGQGPSVHRRASRLHRLRTATLGPQHPADIKCSAPRSRTSRRRGRRSSASLPDEYVIEAVIQSTHDSTLAPEGKHTLTLGVQQLPSELAGGGWDARKEGLRRPGGREPL